MLFRLAQVLAVCAIAQTAFPVRYRLVMPTESWLQGSAQAINRDKVLAGGWVGPYTWSESAGLTRLGPNWRLQWDGTAYDLNDTGGVVGSAGLWAFGSYVADQPFYYVPVLGLRRAPIGPGAGALLAVNNSGLAVGIRADTLRQRAFAFHPSHGIMDIGVLDPTGTSVASDVNESGVAVGSATVPSLLGHVWRPLQWSESDGLLELPLPSEATQGEARAINDAGDIVMNVRFKSSMTYFCVYQPGQSHSFLGRGLGLAINSAGQVVGAADFGGRQRACLHEPGRGLVDLESVTQNLPGNWRLPVARDINGLGDIAVTVMQPGYDSKPGLLVRLD
jgi:probable HAF family extracellular repeat protein